MDNEQEIINKAIRVFKDGGVVIYPTDTAYGIGCRLDNAGSIERLFRIRHRSSTQPTPVLVSSIEMAIPYYNKPSNIVRHLMKTYWPGALTIVSVCNTENIYPLVRGGGKTIGIRMPDHPLICKIITGVGVPILGPSANFHGQKTPYETSDLDPDLVTLVDYVVYGECTTKQVSTVIDCTTTPPSVIRQGAVKVGIVG